MKKRLDILIFEKGYSKSREDAKRLILSGNVLVYGHVSDKAGMLIDENLQIEVKEKFPYVSRGATKLEKAYLEFGIDFKNKIVCDIGASTGGFTDFVLQHGAKKVYAVDVGYGQLDQKLRNDPRVVNMERTNIRDLDSWEKFQNAVILGTSMKCRRSESTSSPLSSSPQLFDRELTSSGDLSGTRTVELQTREATARRPESKTPSNVIPELRHGVGNIRNPEGVIYKNTSWIPAYAGMTKKKEGNNKESVETIDIFVIDVSFISLKSVLPVVKQITVNSKQKAEEKKTKDRRQMTYEVVALIKPQFEVGKKIADKCKGVIKDEAIRVGVVEDIKKFAVEQGFKVKGVTDSPILGAKGNKEFLIYLKI